MRRLFCLLAGLLYASSLAAEPLCPTNHFDSKVTVGYVHDGDTLFLTASPGEKPESIRLIGVNTPELAKDERPAEPLAIMARDRLRKKLDASNNEIHLRFDAERRDQYGRLLAHVYTPDGDSLSAWLLQAGLASLLAVPPNLNGLDCYAQQEASARHSGKGIWALPATITDSTLLPETTRGYRLVRGKIIRIGEGRKYLWLNLEGNVAIKINKKDLRWFEQVKPHKLLGKTIIARGWLYAHKEELHMGIRHPYSLEILP